MDNDNVELSAMDLTAEGNQTLLFMALSYQSIREVHWTKFLKIRIINWIRDFDQISS